MLIRRHFCSDSREDNSLAIVILLCLIAGLWAYANANLAYPGLWWDETAQFWISQGIDLYAEPGTLPGDILQAAGLNRYHNLDPGRFTVLEHFWTKLDRTIEWIRSLPFLFLLWLLVFSAILGWQLSRSWLITAVALSIPLAYPGIIYFGMENRAYTMEMSGFVCGIVFLLRALRRNDYWSYGALGAVCALFLSSRYSYVYFVVSVAIVLLLSLINSSRKSDVEIGKRLAVFAAPVVIVALLIAWLMLSYQLQSYVIKPGELGIAAPGYTEHAVLRGNPQFPDILARNMVSLATIPITLSMCYLLFGRRLLFRSMRKRGIPVEADFKFIVIHQLILNPIVAQIIPFEGVPGERRDNPGCRF